MELTDKLIARGVDTVDDLRAFLKEPTLAAQLQDVHGVGLKTVSFLKLLVGLDAIAVDVHIRRALELQGITRPTPEELERLLDLASRNLGLKLADVDAMIWRQMSARRRAT